MPVQKNYPGVYVEEIPSGVRTIAGVATSVTAFIGRALKGQVNDPVTIFNYGEYERIFGGLWTDSTMSYAVRDFYVNGGSQAIILRIDNGADTASADLTTTSSPPGTIELRANSPGEWGNSLLVKVSQSVDPTAPPASPPDSSFYNIEIFEKDVDGSEIKLEEHVKVSLDPDESRYLPRVLKESSAYIEIEETSPGSGSWESLAPLSSSYSLAGGSHGGVLGAGEYEGSVSDMTGIYALKKADMFNLLCIPPPERSGDTADTVYQKALTLCVEERAVLIVDSPRSWGAQVNTAAANAKTGLQTMGLNGTSARNAALFFPRILQADPLHDNQTDQFVPCGVLAGMISRTDTNRGVWKAPAGIDAALNGIRGLQVKLTDDQNGLLNPIGINCLRSFPVYGHVNWGARTLRGANELADEYKYLPVRRTALFIEESLFRGLKWVVFEPNDEPLWGQIRLNVGAFMHNLFRQGAFQGNKKEAYFVKCDSETTTQNDINNGIVNIVVGFSPLKPAEFVVIKLQQIAGQIDT